MRARYFWQLDRELARCSADDKTLTVMIADLGRFKTDQRVWTPGRNRVLRLFAQSLKETRREYDYVARMGGENSCDCPGLTGRGRGAQGGTDRDLAQQAGRKSATRTFSRSRGQGRISAGRIDAEKILSEPTNACYLQKRSQASPKNRRLYPRTRGRLTAEISETARKPTCIVTNDRPGGCYIGPKALVAGIEVATYFLARTYERHDSKRGGAARQGESAGDEVFQEATHEGAPLAGILEQLAASEAVSTSSAVKPRCAHSVKKVLYRSGGISPAELDGLNLERTNLDSVGRCCRCLRVLTTPAHHIRRGHSGRLERFFAIAVDGPAAPFHISHPGQRVQLLTGEHASKWSSPWPGSSEPLSSRRMIPDIQEFLLTNIAVAGETARRGKNISEGEM